MQLKGKVITGAMRGSSLIDIHFDRLVGILGFMPYRGTMDIRLEKSMDITRFSTKAIEHILLDGSKKTDAYLAPVKIIIKGEEYNCWAMRQKNYIYSDTRLEIIAKENLRDKFALKDGDDVDVVMTELPRKRNNRLHFVRNFYSSDKHLMKRK